MPDVTQPAASGELSRAGPATHGPLTDDAADAARRAFDAEALRWLPDIARFARALAHAHAPAEADDLVQETYLRAYRAWDTFRPGTDARRWLFAICRHVHLRRAERARRVVEVEGEPELEALAAVLLHDGAARDGLGDLFDRFDVAPAICAAVAALPAHQRAASVLVDVEGYGVRGGRRSLMRAGRHRPLPPLPRPARAAGSAHRPRAGRRPRGRRSRRLRGRFDAT